MNFRKCLSTFLLVSLSAATFAAAAASYLPVSATYSGLFYETNGFWQQSSGFITLTTTAGGQYTARLQLGPKRYSISGQLDGTGKAARQILRRYEYPLEFEFQVDSEDPDLVTGSLSDGTWTATLFADRSVFNGRSSLSTDAGQYTMIIPGDFASTSTPGGEGYGTITVTKAGAVRFAGVLADGTKFTQSTRVSKGGQWPFYAPLYRGEGSLYGWMLFNGSAEDDLSGDITWIKPQLPSTWFYPAGFAVNIRAWGSRYTRPPSGTKILNITSAQIEFNGGDLDRGITNAVSLDSRNRLVNLSANGLTLAFSPANGRFSGRVMDPITWEWIPFKGVVLQRYGLAAGYFPGWTQTGEVWLEGN